VYLAYRGWLVANVPIVYNMPLPQIIYDLPPEKIFCLTTNPSNLSRLRNVRNEYLKGNARSYSSYEYVKKEIQFANKLFSSRPQWSKIRVTAKPIEEIASNIIKVYRRINKSNAVEKEKIANGYSDTLESYPA